MGYLFSFASLSRETTEYWLNASELLLLLCGLVLAFGAAGEYLEDHGKLPGWMKWSRNPKLVFVWMVALSLFGEFAGDAGVFIFSGHLQTISDSEVAQINNDSEVLKEDNKMLGIDLAQAKKDLLERQAELGVQIDTGLSAVGKTIDAGLSAADKKAEELRRRQRETGPRDLALIDTSNAMADRLKSLAGQKAGTPDFPLKVAALE